MKYQLKQCDPLVEKVLDLYVMKYKRDFDYIEEKLDISHERMMKIIKEISEICSINIYRVEADLYDTLMDNFYTFKPLNVKKNNKTWIKKILIKGKYKNMIGQKTYQQILKKLK